MMKRFNLQIKKKAREILVLSLDFAPIDECKGFTCHPIRTVLIYRKIPVTGVVIRYVLTESSDHEQCHL